jgi:hypothetical protein
MTLEFALRLIGNGPYLESQTLSYRFLQRALQLADDPGKPLVVAITRLVPQKASPITMPP